jgi:hypothetical protein
VTSLLDRIDHHLREFLMGHESATRMVWRILFGTRPTPSATTTLDPDAGS